MKTKRFILFLLTSIVLGSIFFHSSAFAAKAKVPVSWLKDFSPILILLITVVLVISRLPRVELGHTDAFRRRRVFNWLPLGLTYAMLYMGRYNLTVAKSAFGDLMSISDFSIIFAVGTVTYGFSFLINGPLTDRLGGKFAILVGAGGAAVMNILMGLVTYFGYTKNLVVVFSILYAGNMYFQSFGAVAIVKVNAPWFHVRERGVFGAIFGILISLGIFFAFDVGGMIVRNFPAHWVFFTPALLLVVFWILDFFLVRNTPGEAGHKDFDTADASSGDDGPRLPVGQVFKKMMSNPVVLTIAMVEFCSGFLRQSIMNYYRIFAKMTRGFAESGGFYNEYVYKNWGLLLCCAGILGGVFAGVISDRVFQSRRGPVASVLYGLMLVGSIIALFVLKSSMLGWLVIFMSLCVIGVHGMLSGTASMDFGGKKNVGVAVGIIDGFVYLGTGVMAVTYSFILPNACELNKGDKLVYKGKRVSHCQDRIASYADKKGSLSKLLLERKQGKDKKSKVSLLDLSFKSSLPEGNLKKTTLASIGQAFTVLMMKRGKLYAVPSDVDGAIALFKLSNQAFHFQDKAGKNYLLYRKKKIFGSLHSTSKKIFKKSKPSRVSFRSFTANSATYKVSRPGQDPNNWWNWPISMIPMSLLGLLLAIRVWNAKPTSKKS